MSELVPMERDGKRADVHPDEVDAWSEAGWTPADAADTEKPPAKGSARRRRARSAAKGAAEGGDVTED